uniref:Tyrosine-protein phosphatase domain-containing protein n=1 Tax=Ditylenchus dipsaci TaxID=166011 RepID=A0A915DG11_9BILA
MKDAGKKRKPSRKIKGREAQKQLRIFCLKAIETGVEGLVKEFLAIKAETTAAPPKVRFRCNKPKNRYQDSCDSARGRQAIRVTMSMRIGRIPRRKVQFIALKVQLKQPSMTSGVLVKAEEVRSLLAPEQDKTISTSSGLTIKNLNVIQAVKMLTVSRLQVSSNEPNVEPLEVKHVKWNEWPDRGVPKQKMAPFRLLARIHNIEPILVHCSAGIGSDWYNRRHSHGSTSARSQRNPLDACSDQGLAFRRHGSVQTDAQYLYIHRALINWAENKAC